jgi:hypothetical protein
VALLACCLISEARATIAGEDKFPAGILTQVQSQFHLDVQQVTNILGMIQGPEQGRTEWWLDADNEPIWAYAEDIGDGRGVTIGLYGATTGQGYVDADVIWNNYGNKPSATSTSGIISFVKSIANDPKFQKAMFDAYISTYWTPTWNLLAPLGYTSALTFGAVLDTSMNAGMEDDNSKHWGSTHVVQQAIKTQTSPGEAGFLTAFLALRKQYPTANSGDIPQRIQAWSYLLQDNQWSMEGAGLLGCYTYLPGETSGRAKGTCSLSGAPAPAPGPAPAPAPATTKATTKAATTQATTKATTRATTMATTQATTKATTRATTQATTKAATAAPPATTVASARTTTAARATDAVTTAAVCPPCTTSAAEIPMNKWGEAMVEESDKSIQDTLTDGSLLPEDHDASSASILSSSSSMLLLLVLSSMIAALFL